MILNLPPLILMILLLAMPGHGQEKCACEESVAGQRLAGCLEVRVRGAADGAAWRLDGYPGEAEVRVADPELRQRLLAQLAMVRERRPDCGFGGDCRLDQILTLENEELELNIVLPPELERPPGQEGATFRGALCLYYTPRVVAGPFKVAVRIETASGRVSGRTGLTFNLGLGRVPVELRFTAEDLRNVMAGLPNGGVDEEAARTRVIDELRGVAGWALDLARQRGVVDAAGRGALGCPDDPRVKEVAQVIEAELRQRYDLNRRDSRVDWGRFDGGLRFEGGAGVCAGVSGGGGEPTWVLAVRGLQFVRSVRVRVVPDELDRQYTRTLTGRSLHRMRKRVEEELNQRFGGRLQARPGRIVTLDQVEADEALLCHGGREPGGAAACREIQSFVGLQTWPRRRVEADGTGYVAAPNLRYEVRRRMPPERALALRAGGGYSPEERLTARLGLSERQMLRLGEEATVDLVAGPAIRQWKIGVTRPVTPTGSGLRAIGIDWSHLRDNDRRYGNAEPAPIALREAGSTARLTFGHDHLWGGGRTRLAATGDLRLEYRDLRIDERERLPEPLQPAAARSQLANLAVDLQAGLSRTSEVRQGRGLGFYGVTVEARLQRGLRLWGADYDYRKVGGLARAELLFGHFTPTDLLLRHAEGGGSSGATTPVFELFRPGGSRILRGLEEGELIGRRLRHRQTEFGAALPLLGRLFTAPARSALPEPNGSARPTGFDLSRVYLKGFLDRARLDSGRRAAGYGVALELRGMPLSGEGGDGRQLNLSIGYGYSPQSRLHRSGTLITTVMLNF